VPMDGLAGFNSSLWPVKSVTCASLIEGPMFNYCSGVLIARMVDQSLLSLYEYYRCWELVGSGAKNRTSLQEL